MQFALKLEIYEYLLKNKDKLLKRKSSEGVQWFEYGRVQAINSIFVEKLIMSVVITNNVNVILFNKLS